MQLPRLILITDGSRGSERVLASLQSVLSLGPLVGVQHRHPGAPVRDFLQAGQSLAEACARWSIPLFVNQRLEVALLLGAHLHLPADGLALEDARAHLPPDRWISCAVHSHEEAERAAGADLLLASPVFAPGSKPGDSRTPLEVEGFRALAKTCAPPVYALGGITPNSIGRLGEIAGAATLTGVLSAPDPRAAAEALLRALGVL